MPISQICPQCGAELLARSLQGLCPRCLIGGAMKWGMGTGESPGEILTTHAASSPKGCPAHEQRAGSDETASSPQPFPSLREEREKSASPGSLSGTKIRYFGDYEILQEIASGGMGVVYKARQLSLNRLVALKMIRLGQYASPSTIERFHNETEAAARLDHPNIVPIYEVGERDGLHYFSMKLVEGRNLEQAVSGKAFPVKMAAEVLVKVAGAVHYAHQRGILHRDLKPANILMDADVEPYVTDFGLAKLTEKDTSLTISFSVIGTPAYMSPEQAAGGAKQLTIASDVYSLGAILYHLLTGRALFEAGTEVGVLRKVLDEEPIEPSHLNPEVDRDLQTICLKCLQKQPESRYPSAEALAKDVVNWTNGNPIDARPCRRSERILKWAKRPPTLAALTASISSLVLAFVFIGINELSAFRAKIVEDSRIQSGFIAQAMEAPLAFNNVSEAQTILELFKGNPFIASASVFKSNGVLFAQYPKDAPYVRPKTFDSSEHHFQGRYLITTTPISMGGYRLGTVSLRINFQDKLGRIKSYAGLFVVAVIGPVLIRYLLVRVSKSG